MDVELSFKDFPYPSTLKEENKRMRGIESEHGHVISLSFSEPQNRAKRSTFAQLRFDTDGNGAIIPSSTSLFLRVSLGLTTNKEEFFSALSVWGDLPPEHEGLLNSLCALKDNLHETLRNADADLVCFSYFQSQQDYENYAEMLRTATESQKQYSLSVLKAVRLIMDGVLRGPAPA